MDYSLQRLKRDRPDLLEQVASGDLPSLQAVAELAGHRPPFSGVLVDPQNIARLIVSRLEPPQQEEVIDLVQHPERITDPEHGKNPHWEAYRARTTPPEVLAQQRARKAAELLARRQASVDGPHRPEPGGTGGPAGPGGGPGAALPRGGRRGRRVTRPPKTHCVRGHELTPANTHVLPGGRGSACRACRREDARARYERDYRSPWKAGAGRPLPDGGVGALRAARLVTYTCLDCGHRSATWEAFRAHRRACPRRA